MFCLGLFSYLRFSMFNDMYLIAEIMKEAWQIWPCSHHGHGSYMHHFSHVCKHLHVEHIMTLHNIGITSVHFERIFEGHLT